MAYNFDSWYSMWPVSIHSKQLAETAPKLNLFHSLAIVTHLRNILFLEIILCLKRAIENQPGNKTNPTFSVNIFS